MKTNRKLDAWRKAGLLDEEQVARITRWEEDNAPGARWVVWGIAAVGALAVVTGIVSVISANWDNVPPGAKLGVCGLLLLGSLAGAWRTGKLESTWPRDLLLFLHNGMVLASIGLVAQLYHLHGHPWRAAALCAVLALPAAAIARRGLLTYVFLGEVTVGAFLLLDEARWLDDGGHSVRLLASAFGLLLLIGSSVLRKPHEAASAAMRGWAGGVFSIAAVYASLIWSDIGVHFPQDGHHLRSAPIALFAIAVGASVVYEVARPRAGRLPRLFGLSLFVALVAGASVISGWSEPSHATHAFILQLLGFGLFCMLCVALAIASANAGSKRATNLATLALAARILVLYLELAKDLMTTGLGLIATGAVCIGIAGAWWRLRSVLPIVSNLQGRELGGAA